MHEHHERSGLDHLILAFHRMYHGCIRYEMEQNGFQQVAHPVILFILRHRAGERPVTQREIADQLGISPPSIAMSLRRLEKAGLISKQADPDDLRKNCITLTEKGKTFTDQCLRVEQKLYAQVTQGFAPQELETMRSYYLRMMRNMHAIGCRRPQFIKEEAEGL